MQRDTIVYFGIIQFEYYNAMCQHAFGIKKMIESIGYRPVIIGVSPSVIRGQYKKIDENTYSVNDPQNTADRIKECLFSSEIELILKDIGYKRIQTFIMADFRYFPMKKMARYCEHKGINFALDIMDRFVAEESIVSKIKAIDSNVRMKYLYPKIKRRVHICTSYNELLGEGEYTAVIPGVIFDIENKRESTSDDRIKLVFLGRPGVNCEKERIDWVVRAIYEKELTNTFSVYFAGFDEKEFRDSNPELEQYVTENIHYLGRLSHDVCIELLSKSDFSLVIRENNDLSKYGFSTKIGESFSCGIPVLATDTSDNSIYIKNGKTGYICGCNYQDVANMIEQVAHLKRKQIEYMKNLVSINNPLYYECFTESFKKVVL